MAAGSLPGSLIATAGQADASGAPALRWQGNVAAGQLVEIGYEALSGGVTGPTTNVARVTGAGVDLRLSAVVTVTAATAAGDPDFVLPAHSRVISSTPSSIPRRATAVTVSRSTPPGAGA